MQEPGRLLHLHPVQGGQDPQEPVQGLQAEEVPRGGDEQGVGAAREGAEDRHHQEAGGGAHGREGEEGGGEAGQPLLPLP